MPPMSNDVLPDSFEGLIEQIRVRLLPVLWAKWGVEIGSDICSEVEEYAWSHRTKILEMTNPMGYLYRVSQSRSRRYLRWMKRNSFPGHFADVGIEDREIDDSLRNLASLSSNQRVCVLLVHGFDWSYADVAELLEINQTAVNNHLNRGLARLRTSVTDPNSPIVGLEPS